MPDRVEDRPRQVHGQPRAGTRPVGRVRRERVLPALQAETAEDGRVDVPSVLLGHDRAEEGRDACARIPQALRMSYPPLPAWVMDALRKGWTPERIEGRLKVEWPDDPRMRISHECLYRWIYAKPQRALDLRQYLPRGKRHRTRSKGRRSKGPRIPMRVPITDRPKKVDSRHEFGHFESDTVVGASPSKRCIDTQVERKSRRCLCSIGF